MMRRTTLQLLFFFGLGCSPIAAQETMESIVSSYSIAGCRYWFDNSTQVTQTSYANGKIALDVSALEEGFHTLHYQILDSRGEVSPARTAPFFRLQRSGEQFKDYTIKSVRYWFDKDYTPHEVAYVSGTSAINVSALEEGFHTLHYQVIDSKGEASPSRTSAFFRLQPTDEQFKDYTIAKVRYWFDKDYTPHEVTYVSGTSAIDVSALEDGFHTLHYQVIDSKGEASPSRTSSFFRVQSVDEQFKDYTIQKVRYWFDKDYTPLEVAYIGGTSAIDVSALEEGFHTLHYQVIDSKGEASPSRTSPFFRVQPTEEQFKGYAVKSMQYWFDNDISTMRTEPFDVTATTLNLSHLPEGIHTLCYQVKTDDGQVSPVRSVSIDRWLYDIYVSRWTEYGDSIATHDPLFATRPDLKLHYRPDDTNVRGHLTVDEGATLSLGKFVQTANWGNKNDGNKYAKSGNEYYHPTTLLNNGQMRADSVLVKQSLYRDRWHFLALPFNVNVSDISIPNGTYYALRAYDGEARASGEMTDTWQNLGKDDKMEAGQGYIVQLTRESSDKTAELTFKSINDPQKNNIFATADVVTTLQEHQAEFAHNRSWNLIGNPYPSFYDSRSIDHDGTIIVWNGNGYTAYSLADDSYILMPFEAFFIQRAVDSEALTFNASGRQHTSEPQAVAPARVKNANANVERRILNFILSDGQQSDRSRIVLNEQASMGYETDKDAPKFMESKPAMPQLYSVEAGVKYSINERPVGKGFATLSVYVPETGEYVLRVDGYEGVMDNLTIYDSDTNETWPVVRGDYTFTAEAGYYDGRFVVAFLGDATAISQPNITEDGEISVLNGQLSFSFAKAKHISVYSMDGIRLYSNYAANGEAILASGVYVVDIDGKRTKIIIK